MPANDHLLSETTTVAGSSGPPSELESTATVVMPRPSVTDLPHHSDDAGPTSSVRTIKGNAEEKATEPKAAAFDVVAPNATEPKTPTTPLDPPDVRSPSPTKITPATLASPVTSPVFPPSAFTHRFTIVKPIGSLKPAPPAPGARKGSSQAQGIIGWAFSAAGLTPPNGGSSASNGGGGSFGSASYSSGGKGKKKAKLPKCEVCRFKVKGAGPHLRCDDCNCQSTACCPTKRPDSQADIPISVRSRRSRQVQCQRSRTSPSESANRPASAGLKADHSLIPLQHNCCRSPSPTSSTGH